MAQRRFLYRGLMESDNFLKLTNAQKILYVFLVLTADDDGINNNIKTQQYYTNTKESDVEALEKHGFVFKDSDSGALCIVDWHYHNAPPKDRYKETDILGFKKKIYVDDYAKLTLNETPIPYLKYKGGSMNTCISTCMTEIENEEAMDMYKAKQREMHENGNLLPNEYGNY